jgi:pimeloyl-ACP methyl ester carboxylesterase
MFKIGTMKLEQHDYIIHPIGGVEVTIFTGNNPDDAPAVFFTHGKNGCKISHYEYCRELNKVGLNVFAIDQRNHGKRTMDQTLTEFESPFVVAELFSEVVGTAKDISFLIDTIPSTTGLNPKRWGLIGGSLGAIASIQTMTHDQRINCVASIVGSGDFKGLVYNSISNTEILKEEVDEQFDAATIELYKEYDAINHVEKLNNRPLLLCAGEIDDIVPAQNIYNYYQKAAAMYVDKDNIEYREYKDAGHGDTPEMKTDCVEWLRKQLLVVSG